MVLPPTSDPDTLLRLQQAIVAALGLADSNGLFNVAIGLDEARLALIDDFHRIGLDHLVTNVPPPDWPD